jgi:hypothetical protein
MGIVLYKSRGKNIERNICYESVGLCLMPNARKSFLRRTSGQCSFEGTGCLRYQALSDLACLRGRFDELGWPMIVDTTAHVLLLEGLIGIDVVSGIQAVRWYTKPAGPQV